MKKITINLQDSYDIIIDNNIDINKYIKDVYSNKNIFLIVDESLNDYEKDLLKQLNEYDTKLIRIKSSEENKSLDTYNYIISKLLEFNITRDSLIISLGGGVVGDISGFVASTILRGVKYVSIPTTLLSQVDSSIGGKTGLNINSKKNMIGSFYQPSLVLIDTKYLSTLSKEELYNGLGEVVKCGMIHDKEILSLLKDNLNFIDIIYKSLLVKKYYVEKDPLDKNERMILNFGHTFGHIIELQKNIKHGYAVIQGMILSLKYGIDLKISHDNTLNKLLSIIKHLDITILDLDYKDYLSKLSSDKKSIENRINFIFLNDINKPIIKQIKRD